MDETKFLEVKRENFKKTGTVYSRSGGIFGDRIIQSLIEGINSLSSVR